MNENDGELVEKKVRMHHWRHGRLYIIENVDAEVCPECGERYYHAKTIDNINRLIDSEHDVEEIMRVEVVRL